MLWDIMSHLDPNVSSSLPPSLILTVPPALNTHKSNNKNNSIRTYMQSRAPLLDAHVVALAQDLAILRDKARADGYTTFGGAFAGFFQRGSEAWVVHGHRILWGERLG